MAPPSWTELLWPGRLPAIGAGAGVVLILSVANLLWTAPWSPLAVQRADALLGSGQPVLAVQAYDRITSSSPFPRLAEQALYRSAMVWSVELDRPAEARKRLISLVDRTEDPVLEARIETEIGNLLAEERQVERAAERFEDAFRAAPDDPDAVHRAVAAARLRAEVEHYDRALTLWDEIETRFPAEIDLARVGRAEALLARGDAHDALREYEAVAESSFDGPLSAVARLGEATCLERLGDLDEALAELDFLELPRDVLDTRRGEIRDRRAVGGSRL